MGYLDRFRRAGDRSAPPPPAAPPSPPPHARAVATLSLAELAGGADRITVVDCETTGVYNSDRVVELAIVTMDLEGNILESWDTLVHPQRDVGATHIHGLTAQSLRDAPTFADVAGDIAIRLHGACLAAHNLPFDARMLCGEFTRLDVDLTVLSGIDTLTATRSRLAIACAQNGVALHKAHSALADATATAQLLSRVSAHCQAGSPSAAPTSLIRSGRVLRRADASIVDLPDPPHVVGLAARLDHVGLEANVLAYLELVGRAVADLHVSADERRQLGEFAVALGLDDAQLAQAHRRFVNDLTDAALSDQVLTDEEQDMLLRISSALGVSAATVEHRTRPVRTTAVAVEIQPGLNVTFTGDDPQHPREGLVAYALQLGLNVLANVTKKSDLLVAFDTASSSGKASKARAYGVPVVSTALFAVTALGDVLEGEGSAVEAKKVVTCPDCHTTWTVSAKSGAQRSRRCADCTP